MAGGEVERHSLDGLKEAKVMEEDKKDDGRVRIWKRDGNLWGGGRWAALISSLLFALFSSASYTGENLFLSELLGGCLVREAGKMNK